MTSCESRVGAYAHTTVAIRLLSSVSRTVIRRSLMPWGSSLSCLTRLLLMAKQTLVHQQACPSKRSYILPFPLSVSFLPPFWSWIRLQCQHWTFAVLLLRRLWVFLAVHWSHCQEGCERCTPLKLKWSFLCFFFWPHGGNPSGRGNPAGKVVRQAISWDDVRRDCTR